MGIGSKRFSKSQLTILGYKLLWKITSIYMLKKFHNFFFKSIRPYSHIPHIPYKMGLLIERVWYVIYLIVGFYLGKYLLSMALYYDRKLWFDELVQWHSLRLGLIIIYLWFFVVAWWIVGPICLPTSVYRATYFQCNLQYSWVFNDN